MGYNFPRSAGVLRELAQRAARTPPPEQGSSFEFLDQSFLIVGRTFDSRDQWMRQEFLGQRDFISKQLEELGREITASREEIGRRVQEMRQETRRQFKEVTDRIDMMEEKFDTKMRLRFDQMQNASRNCLRTRGWEEIYPVGKANAQGVILLPENFPRTVARFWNLKDSIDRLIYLIRFYGIQGYEEWGRWSESSVESDSDESTETSNTSRIPITLEGAVRTNPEIAHRALAGALGLAYDGIEAFMQRAEKTQQAPTRKPSKRRPDEPNVEDGKRRLLRISPNEELTDVTSPTEVLSFRGRSQ